MNSKRRLNSDHVLNKIMGKEEINKGMTTKREIMNIDLKKVELTNLVKTPILKRINNNRARLGTNRKNLSQRSFRYPKRNLISTIKTRHQEVQRREVMIHPKVKRRTIGLVHLELIEHI